MSTGSDRRIRSLLLLVMLGIAGACNNTLETGYAYHPLNASDVERRAYYAPAFSPESHVPKHESSGFSAGP